MIGDIVEMPLYSTIQMLLTTLMFIVVFAFVYMWSHSDDNWSRLLNSNRAPLVSLFIAAVTRCVYGVLCLTGGFSSSLRGVVAAERVLWSFSFASTYVAYGLVARRIMYAVRRAVNWKSRRPNPSTVDKHAVVILWLMQLPPLLAPIAMVYFSNVEFSTIVYWWAAYFGFAVLVLNIYLLRVVQQFIQLVTQQDSVSSGLKRMTYHLRMIRGLTVVLSIMFLSALLVGLLFDLACCADTFVVYEALLSIPQCLAVAGMTVLMSPLSQRVITTMINLTPRSSSETFVQNDASRNNSTSAQSGGDNTSPRANPSTCITHISQPSSRV